MKTKFFVFLAIIIALIASPKTTYASVKISGASAAMVRIPFNQGYDYRAQILQKYLEEKKSPLAPYAEVFVEEADKNDIDWKLVAAISGLESSFGKRIPPNSYNGWGWGIYGDHVKRFSSWEEAIATISAGLRNDYMNKWKAQNLYEIGRYYASSPTWAVRVEMFMNQIDTFATKQQNLSLSISI